MRQVIILGGGTSVIEGIQLGLFKKLEDKFTVGLNYSHHFVNTTFLMYVDETFAGGQKAFFDQIPLIIGMEHASIPMRKNLIELPGTTEYYEDCSRGVYKASLVGIFALSFLVHALDEGDEIYLLGYDYGAKKGNGSQGRAYDVRGKALTHWYQHGDLLSVYSGKPQQITHRGIGKINWYECTENDKETGKRVSRAENEFKVYKNVKKVKIYNVSSDSRISVFPKISYQEFFKQLKRKKYDQDQLRQEMAEKAVLLRKTLKG